MRPDWLCAVGLLLCASGGSDPMAAGLQAEGAERPAPLEIEARVLDAEGAPLVSRALAVVLGATTSDLKSRPLHVDMARTDSDGRVKLAAPAALAGSTLHVRLTLEGDPQRSCWNGSVEAKEAAIALALGDVMLRPPRRPTPNDSVRNLANLDDELLERLLRECLERFVSKQRSDPRWGSLLSEACRRGGDRWREFLAARLSEVKSEGNGPQRHCKFWTPLLDAVRYLEGRPALGKVLVHPEDRDGEPRAELDGIRFAVINLDPTESIVLQELIQIVRFEVEDALGHPAPRQPTIHRHWKVPESNVSLKPGEAAGWWVSRLSDDYLLGEGDWTVRLLYSPCDSIDPFTGTSDLPLFESEPFVVRIRK